MTGRLLLLLTGLVLVACQPTAGVYHTVRNGQDLKQLSRVYGVDEMTLARINGVESPESLAAGDTIFVPGAKQVINPVAGGTHPPVSVGDKEHRSRDRDTNGEGARAVVNRQPLAAAKADRPAATRDRFIWPLKGEVVRRYGDRLPTPCKGIEIGAATGTPVVAAAAGRVIYSGDGIRSYGNLIILRHDDGYFTVYGYNRSNLVAAGKFVSRGERIALSGAPPSGERARLYFEVRFGKEPVDPSFYLP